MSVYFIGDPHLGHRNIAQFRSFVPSTEVNTQMILDEWKSRITKNDLVFVMGDAAFDDFHLELLGELRGRKILIKGNHDDLASFSLQTRVFEEIHGMLRYKKCWLTHCPIHPDEMRRCVLNVHGHVHNQTVRLPQTKLQKFFRRPRVEDPRYINTCVDYVYPRYGSVFMTLDQVKERIPT
jgi:calcineurin-like phosphoesterase family protein